MYLPTEIVNNIIGDIDILNISFPDTEMTSSLLKSNAKLAYITKEILLKNIHTKLLEHSFNITPNNKREFLNLLNRLNPYNVYIIWYILNIIKNTDSPFHLRIVKINIDTRKLFSPNNTTEKHIRIIAYKNIMAPIKIFNLLRIIFNVVNVSGRIHDDNDFIMFFNTTDDDTNTIDTISDTDTTDIDSL